MPVHRKVHVVAESEDQAERLVRARLWGFPVTWVGNFAQLMVVGDLRNKRDKLYECHVVFGSEVRDSR